MIFSKQTFCTLSIVFFSTFTFTNAISNPVNTNVYQQQEIIKRTYKLKKFTQSCCARILEYSLKEVEGFIKHESNIKNQEITIWFNSNTCKEQDIKDAINKTSYKIIE